jgi:hypothetical protein
LAFGRMLTGQQILIDTKQKGHPKSGFSEQEVLCALLILLQEAKKAKLEIGLYQCEIDFLAKRHYFPVNVRKRSK